MSKSNSFTSIWQYRHFVIGTVKRNFEARYSNSLLGFLWPFLTPFSMVVVYMIVFSNVMVPKMVGGEEDYAYGIYLCSGLLVWGFFSEIISNLITIFQDNANLLKKLNFPSICLPVIVIFNALINFIIVFSIFLIFLIAIGKLPGFVMLNLIPLVLLITLFSLGLGLCLAVLNVFFRDTQQFFAVWLFFWFWLTPITYPKTILSNFSSKLILFNPMTSIISAFQDVTLRHQSPSWGDTFPAIILTIILMSMGFHLFRKFITEILDEV